MVAEKENAKKGRQSSRKPKRDKERRERQKRRRWKGIEKNEREKRLCMILLIAEKVAKKTDR